MISLSRFKLIKAIFGRCQSVSVDGYCVPANYREDIYDEIKALPPVTPTHKVGYWDKTGGSFRCSECMHMPEFRDIRTLKYCPNCGAEMRGKEEV